MEVPTLASLARLGMMSADRRSPHEAQVLLAAAVTRSESTAARDVVDAGSSENEVKGNVYVVARRNFWSPWTN